MLNLNGGAYQATTMKKVFLRLGTYLTLALALIFAFSFIKRSALSYNSEGNYFDERSATVYHEQSVAVFALLSVVSFGVTLLVGYYSFRK